MRKKPHNQNNSGPIRNVQNFVKAYLNSETGKRVLNYRGNNLIAHKLKEKVVA